MTWDEYYEKFYDWARSTQIKHLSSIEHLGPEDEVAELLMDFAFDHKNIANRLARKAIEDKVQFTAENIADFKLNIDDDLLDQLAIQSADKFSKDDLEELYCLISDDALRKIYQAKGVKPFFDFEDSAEEQLDDFDMDEVLERAKQPTGFFSKLAMTFGIGAGIHMGINDATQGKPRRFRVGDHVRVRYLGQEGTIIDINGDLYMVSLNDGGYADSFTESQIERAW